MNKKLICALLALMLLFTLTGCVASVSTEDTADRPSVVVSIGETVLEATEQAETRDAETGEMMDTRVLNTAVPGDLLTLTGKHASGIQSLCYRFDGGEVTLEQTDCAEVALPEGAQLLELYVIGGNGIASHWASYYFE